MTLELVEYSEEVDEDGVTARYMHKCLVCGKRHWGLSIPAVKVGLELETK